MLSPSTSQTKRLDLTDEELTVLEDAVLRYEAARERGQLGHRPMFNHTTPYALLHKIRKLQDESV